MSVTPRWSDGLPSFRRPPVTEVAVGIYFLDLPGLNTVELVRLHSIFAHDFPTVVEQPPLPPVPSRANAGPSSFQFQLVSTPTVRMWMLSPDESLLIQVQADRLILNWRLRPHNGDPYPRYSFMREKFLDLWLDFVEYGEHEKFGAIQPTHAEVTFFNRLSLLAGESMGDYLHPLRSESGLQDANKIGFQAEIPVRSSFGGNGTTTINAGQDRDQGRVVNLEINTRIDVHVSSPIGILDPLDLAHACGVRMFDRLITSYASERWEKR